VKVVIAQSDVVTSYGWGMDPLWSGLLSGKPAIRPTPWFAERGFVSNQAALIADLDTNSDGSRVMAMLRRLLTPLAGKFDPQTPILLATIVGEIEYVQRAVLDDEAQSLAQARPERLLQQAKTILGLRGSGMVVSSACASSSAAIALAASMIRKGQTEKVLVVACDAVSEFVYSGFSGLLSLSTQPARPFGADCDGLSLGEAAAWALVTDARAPEANGCSAEILGWASATDAVHMTATDRCAQGLSRAIEKACGMAKRSPQDVALIAAHGTGTPFNDTMEMTAFRAVFVEPRPTFSIKGGAGHTLGAAGLLQLLVVCKALATGIVPGTVGLNAPDPLARDWVSRKPTAMATGGLALSTNSGFGGVNTAILLEGAARS